MSKPTMKKGKARSSENGVDDVETLDGHGQGYEELESVLSHQPHQKEPAGGLTASPEDAKSTPAIAIPPRTMQSEASFRGCTRVVLRLRAQAENDASIGRTKPLYSPAHISPSSISASASRSRTKVNTYCSSNARCPVSRLPATHPRLRHPSFQIRIIAMAMWDDHRRIVNPRDIPLV
jgi:hypothetical protein